MVSFADRRCALRILAGVPLAAGAAMAWPSRAAAAQALFSQADASLALRTALERGASAAVGLLGRQDGYFRNPKVYIDLPPAAEKVAGVLRMSGHQDKVDSLLLAMNRAAEQAAPAALPLLTDAVRHMSVEDARAIIQGGDTSVTQFFARTTREPLTGRFKPIVTEATRSVALVEKYNAVVGKAGSWGLLAGREDVSVEGYVTRKALDGLYLMIGEEERKIRQDPVSTGVDILKKVFGR